jgi:hypothetical protein
VAPHGRDKQPKGAYQTKGVQCAAVCNMAYKLLRNEYMFDFHSDLIRLWNNTKNYTLSLVHI